jgi:acyl CoA:acetate/3-ketoacid CoA transferase beta subunit
VTNLAVYDFNTPDHHMRVASLHPGVSIDDVVAATGFELVIPADIPTTRLPTDEELTVLREVLDPRSFRDRELPA